MTDSKKSVFELADEAAERSGLNDDAVLFTHVHAASSRNQSYEWLMEDPELSSQDPRHRGGHPSELVRRFSQTVDLTPYEKSVLRFLTLNTSLRSERKGAGGCLGGFLYMISKEIESGRVVPESGQLVRAKGVRKGPRTEMLLELLQYAAETTQAYGK